MRYEERITITIDPNGNPTIKVEGVAGSGCKALTKDIEEALGTTVKDSPTAEMRLPDARTSHKSRQGR